ncbi:MAG: DUF6308 family protein [Proteobacteria bacterium]|nr:DUF6308 family protein [Pseudomonadota bacterium]
MTIDIRLRSGLIFRDADRMLIEKFGEWPWGRYDGDPPKDPNVIDPVADVDRVYQLGMRSPKQAYHDLIQTHGKAITSCLRRLPAEQTLEETDLNAIRAPLIKLYGIVAGTPRVRIAGATKLLHPFRPQLLPVIDSFICGYYKYAAPISDEPAFHRLWTAEKNGDYGTEIFELMYLMREDIRGAAEQFAAVRAACRDAPFSAASNVRLLDSLIWYYFARRATEQADGA